MKKLRCAIYTRKSSEEGLEQAFNSLDAQHESCAAYILSQASEGWVALKDTYDDGGLSGGTLQRPALQRLLSDIAVGKVDIVVVYKVDRLTRALLDFAKLVEAFDRAGTSFVSVTQSFNTTTSMGRLTLNMLLSFAQFEREVTAERIRDKIRASKAKGLWMGGTPPLGYCPNERSLAIVPDDAEAVRTIYQRFLTGTSVRHLADAFKAESVRVPTRILGSGKEIGGGFFTRGQIYAILSNPLYAGRIRHGDRVYPGQHPALIAPEIWDQTQALTDSNRRDHRRDPNAEQRSLLSGKLVSPDTEAMIASHTCKGKRRYRYYVSRSLQRGEANDGKGLRLPAKPLETAVIHTLIEAFKNPFTQLERLGNPSLTSESTTALIEGAKDIVNRLGGGTPSVTMAVIDELVERIQVKGHAITIQLSSSAVTTALGIPYVNGGDSLDLIAPIRLRLAGRDRRLIVPSGQANPPDKHDLSLIKAIVRARQWWQRLCDRPEMGIHQLAIQEGINPSYLTRILRLAFLDPAIVERLLAGTAPATFTLSTLLSADAIPALWSEQQRIHGFTEATA